MALTAKKRRFAREFLIDRNATKAAIRAGYSQKTAKAIGCELRKEPEVAALIHELEANLAAKVEVTAERVVRELALIGFANMQDYITIGSDGDPCVDLSALTREQAAAIMEVTVEDFKDGRGEDARDVRRVKFRLADKRAALVDLGKHLGLFREVDRTVNVNLRVDESKRADEFTRRIAGLAPADGAGSGTGETRSVH